MMSVYAYSPEKNLKLIQERNISFEEIIAAIVNGQILGIEEHPNQKKYGRQRIYVVYTPSSSNLPIRTDSKPRD
jgi:hypothetical protein